MRIHNPRSRLTAAQKRELARIAKAEDKTLPRNRLERELTRLRQQSEVDA